MRKSTIRIFKMHGWRVDHAIHNYVYFVFYSWYVKVFLAAGRFLVGHFGNSRWCAAAFKQVYENYHAKVLTFNDAQKIVKLDHDVIISPSQAKRIIPFGTANQIIFNEPTYIAVMDCPCRLSRDKYCQPVNVCMAIGRTTAEFWLDHCAKYNVRRINQSEALEILEKSHEAGRIITAWLKTETGGRTGVVCSCCSCCCGGLEGMRLARRLPENKIVTNIVASGYSVIIDPALCAGCGVCGSVCAFSAVSRDHDGKSAFVKEMCHGCGVCVDKCPQTARKLILDPDRGEPLDVSLAAV